jgi:1-acyl-sn-glycerol-3-phosphate acyltransferase
MIKALDYWRRLLCKAVCYFFFGIGAFVLGALVYPVLIVAVRDKLALRRISRSLVSSSFRLFIFTMGAFGLVRVEFENEEALRGARGLIVAANHPSLIDIIILASRIPQADCIVKRALWDTPFVRWIVRCSYIPNSLGFPETVQLCSASLAEGNSLVVFPEGTRTKEGQPPKLQRGAARVALSTGRDIVPVRIYSDDTRGLRKGDPFLSLPREGPIRFKVRVMPMIKIEDYAGTEAAIAARALTKRLSEAISTYSSTEPALG